PGWAAASEVETPLPSSIWLLIPAAAPGSGRVPKQLEHERGLEPGRPSPCSLNEAELGSKSAVRPWRGRPAIPASSVRAPTAIHSRRTRLRHRRHCVGRGILVRAYSSAPTTAIAFRLLRARRRAPAPR